MVIAGANVHDTKLLAQTIEAIVCPRPNPGQGSMRQPPSSLTL